MRNPKIIFFLSDARPVTSRFTFREEEEEEEARENDANDDDDKDEDGNRAAE